MKTIKLHTALKVKNRLAGEVARLQGILARENARRNDNTSKIIRADILNQLDAARKKLLSVKTEIAKANVLIYAALAELEETKAQIAFYSALPVREGPEIIPTHTEKLEYVWTSYLNREKLDNLVAELQKRANDLQDEIDAFNAGATISVEID
jgi:hypothetical protein